MNDSVKRYAEVYAKDQDKYAKASRPDDELCAPAPRSVRHYAAGLLRWLGCTHVQAHVVGCQPPMITETGPTFTALDSNLWSSKV